MIVKLYHIMDTVKSEALCSYFVDVVSTVEDIILFIFFACLCNLGPFFWIA